jgi:hypothetical protein
VFELLLIVKNKVIRLSHPFLRASKNVGVLVLIEYVLPFIHVKRSQAVIESIVEILEFMVSASETTLSHPFERVSTNVGKFVLAV